MYLKDLYSIFCICCCMSEACLPTQKVSTVETEKKTSSSSLDPSSPVQSAFSSLSSLPNQTLPTSLKLADVVSEIVSIPAPENVATREFESYASTIFRSKSVKLADAASFVANMHKPQGGTDKSMEETKPQ